MYENIFNLYNADLANVKIRSNQSVEIGTDAPTLLASGKYGTVTQTLDINVTATLTGRYVAFNDGTLGYQIIFNNQYGYMFSNTMYQWSKVVDNSLVSKAQSVVAEMIENNKAILENNLLCARGLQIMTENGAAMPTGFRTNLYNLQARLINRNIKLKQSGYVSDVQEATSPNFSIYNQGLVDFMNNPGIGFVISTTAAIIITCVIIAATAAAAWTLFKTMHAESKSDFKLSSELTADLIKYLPPEVYQQLVKENAANAAKAQDAIDKASGKQWINIIKYGAIGYGVIWAWEKLQQNSIKNYGNAKLN